MLIFIWAIMKNSSAMCKEAMHGTTGKEVATLTCPCLDQKISSNIKVQHCRRQGGNISETHSLRTESHYSNKDAALFSASNPTNPPRCATP